ncbi:hypothetical protein M405DRAFT_806162 [Rhizopogon salebrosus TDB-379]|nr:hypothetical protein M405DRAFT_806162 [Rhizopogon salebrosus TDB-379]
MTKTLTRVRGLYNNWPVSSEAARHDLETMVETHRVVPIPAYDADGNFIHPQNYRKMLRGAIVQVDFHLTHWSIARKQDGTSAVDSYTADVVSIRVLEPVAGPSKKKSRKYEDNGKLRRVELTTKLPQSSRMGSDCSKSMIEIKFLTAD